MSTEFFILALGPQERLASLLQRSGGVLSPEGVKGLKGSTETPQAAGVSLGELEVSGRQQAIPVPAAKGKGWLCPGARALGFSPQGAQSAAGGPSGAAGDVPGRGTPTSEDESR